MIIERAATGEKNFKYVKLIAYISPTSPASSNYAIIASPQLSVRFANQTDQDTSDNSRVEQLSEDQSICLSPLIKDNNRENFPSEANSSEKYNKTNKSAFLTAPRKKKSRKNLWLSLQESDDFFYRCDKESPIYMEPISPLNLPEINSDEDDYSVSVSAIMQRRLSTKRASRKGKSRKSVTSPLDLLEQKDRRRSSVYTTSSGDTAITMEETNNQDSSQEQIFENIRIHKEVLQQVKWQPWTMKRKLRLVQQAKNYIARHEGELQERFASSRSTRDILARFKIVIGTWFAQKWQHTKRELANLSTWLIPWELRIKEIESHFGSVVASYFTFLRWLFWVNIVIAVVLIVFLAVPELITMDMNTTDRRKKMSAEEEAIAGKLITIWEFEGFLKYSPLFYGYYTKEKYSGIMWWYNLPLAYFLTGVAVYIYSFYATLQKMAENSRMSKLSSKDDECTFSWKIFTGWDFMIGHAETAQNRLSSVILGFKEALLEESEKKKDARNWKIICLRIFVNLVVLALLIISAVAVILVVQDSKQVTDQSGWFKRNEITLVLSAISFFFPMFFESLGILEYYHPRKQLRIQLARIMVLNLLNLYSLIFALFDKISYMSDDSQKLRKIIEPPLSNGFETATMMAMSSITPEQAITAITTVATILTSILNTKQNKSAMTTTTEMPGKLTTFYDGIEASTPYDLELDENRNIISEKTTSEENFILTTTPIYLETEETPIGSQNNEYDPSDEHYYLYTDEELKKLELEQKTRKKRQISIEPENATTVMFDDDMSNFTMTDDYENMNFTDDALNGTDFNENSTLSMPVTDETTMTGTESDTTTIKTTQLMTSELGTTPSTYFTQTQTIPTTTMLTTTTMMPVEEANRKIRNLCWETMFGQELVKLTVMDLIITIGSTMFLDFFRALFVRYMNGCWCWDLEKQYPHPAFSEQPRNGVDGFVFFTWTCLDQLSQTRDFDVLEKLDCPNMQCPARGRFQGITF
uniref:CSON002176 protein n=1 Tax=Culicoides sonorensis TaxID=179676 RepID=A0A336LRN1_CULSO